MIILKADLQDNQPKKERQTKYAYMYVVFQSKSVNCIFILETFNRISVTYANQRNVLTLTPESLETSDFCTSKPVGHFRQANLQKDRPPNH